MSYKKMDEDGPRIHRTERPKKDRFEKHRNYVYDHLDEEEGDFDVELDDLGFELPDDEPF